jgi:uncharacterized delta-60 repeat protein
MKKKLSTIAAILFIISLLQSNTTQAQPGTLDASFGYGGTTVTSVGNGNNNRSNSIAIQGDGKIIAGGNSTNSGTLNDFSLVRYNINGSLDATFGNGGKVTTAIGNYDDLGNAVAIHSDNKIVLIGNYHTGSGSIYGIA